MKSTYCEYILEKILSTSEVGPILALIAPSPFISLLSVDIEWHGRNESCWPKWPENINWPSGPIFVQFDWPDRKYTGHGPAGQRLRRPLTNYLRQLLSWNISCDYSDCGISEKYYSLEFLAHLAFRPCDLLSSHFVRRRPSTFHMLIFSSETTGPIATKLWWNGPWMAPFQNCVRWSRLPTKMAAKLKIEKRGDEILIVHCCFSVSQNELKF